MHAHFVLAHSEPQSFNAHLARSGAAALEAEGWTVSVSDLYAMGFDPCERPEHFVQRVSFDRFDVQAEQRHASATGTLPRAVADELTLMDRADLLILQYPMWWHLPPAMLKGWLDRILAYVGYTVLAPFVAYGVEAGLRYSDSATVEARLKGIVGDFRAALLRIDERATIPFNRKAERGPDGRILPEAPVYSPFIRRKQRLELE